MADTGITPRLLNSDEARDYLRGMDPRELGVSPVRSGRRIRYDRVALDLALDALAGIGEGRTKAKEAPATPLQEWQARHAE